MVCKPAAENQQMSYLLLIRITTVAGTNECKNLLFHVNNASGIFALIKNANEIRQ